MPYSFCFLIDIEENINGCEFGGVVVVRGGERAEGGLPYLLANIFSVN